MAFLAASLLARGQDGSTDPGEAGNPFLLNMPKNLARSHMGASVLIKDGDQYRPIGVESAETALIGDDESSSFALVGGENSLVIDLGASYPVNSVAFRSYSAKGKARVMASSRLKGASSHVWREVARPREFAVEEFVRVPFPSIDARYVRIDVEALLAGEISNINISGDITIEDVVHHGKIRLKESEQIVSAEEDALVLDVDFASLYSGSSIDFGPSSADLVNMFDENLQSYSTFSTGRGGQRVLRVSFGSPRSIDKLAISLEGFEGGIAVYSAESVRLGGTRVNRANQLVQLDLLQPEMTEFIEIVFLPAGPLDEQAGLGPRIYELSLIGPKEFNPRIFEDGVIFREEETIVDISNPTIPDKSEDEFVTPPDSPSQISSED